MSTGLTIHAIDGALAANCYAQEVAYAFFEGFFEQLQDQGLSNFSDFISDGEGDWSDEISKLPDPDNPKPEEISAIEAKLSEDHAADNVLREAEKAFAAMQEMPESEFPNLKALLLSDFDEEVLPALREAAEKNCRIELVVA